jgi:mannose-6-phosphate isomerase-like protein (cupin superfamily)
MFIRQYASAEPFHTKDGSIIRSLLDLSCAPVQAQSLAEATLSAGQATTRHKHPLTEEFYYITAGSGVLEIDGETRTVTVGDACLIPAGATHQIYNAGPAELKILCCCSPPYSHEDTTLLDDGPAVASRLKKN